MLKFLVTLLLIGSTVHATLLRYASDNIVVDTQTGLMWQDDTTVATNATSWESAISSCEALSNTFSDWRLPNHNELTTIVDRSRSEAIYDTFTNHDNNGSYWSSTTRAGSDTEAWTVDWSYHGFDTFKTKTDSHRVRCVRSGQTDTKDYTFVQNLPLVLIAVSYNDQAIGDSATNWSNKIFGTSHSQLNHYYDEISLGNFAFTKASETQGTANDGIINVSINRNHPGQSGFGATDIIDAVNAANPFIDFSAYDSDNNGAISQYELQIMLIVGGGETSIGDGAATSIWAYASSIETANAPVVDHVRVTETMTGGKYSAFGERQGANFATIGIIAHELGHAVFNLPDLYDTNSSLTGASRGIGAFGLMGSGSWNKQSGEDAGATPAPMSAWTRLQQNGWITPTVFAGGTQNITLNATDQANYNIIKITTDDPNEYFLVENRTPAAAYTIGYDRGLYALAGTNFLGGVAIWHIDEDQLSDFENANADETHKLVDLEEADNGTNMDDDSDNGVRTNLFYSGNATSFTDATTPNSKKYDGSTTNISVTNIGTPSSSMTITFSK
jgi:M6 family metalloprotease-like protein